MDNEYYIDIESGNLYKRIYGFNSYIEWYIYLKEIKEWFPINDINSLKLLYIFEYQMFKYLELLEWCEAHES